MADQNQTKFVVKTKEEARTKEAAMQEVAADSHVEMDKKGIFDPFQTPAEEYLTGEVKQHPKKEKSSEKKTDPMIGLPGRPIYGKYSLLLKKIFYYGLVATAVAGCLITGFYYLWIQRMLGGGGPILF